MTYTTYSAAEAASRAKATTAWTHNYCLNFVMNMLTPTVRSPYYDQLSDANASWQYAQLKETTGVPPAGAPVYWHSGTHGHIAISLGNGDVRSTDYPAFGQVGTVNMWKLTNLWGMTYRGWSRDYAGLHIQGLSSDPTTVNDVIPPALTNAGATDMNLTDSIGGGYTVQDALNRIMGGIPATSLTGLSGKVDTLAKALSDFVAQESGRYSSNYQTDKDRYSVLQTALDALKAELDALKTEVDGLPKA